jgi:hypothetical protein
VSGVLEQPITKQEILTPPRTARFEGIGFAATILTSAFLLFQVQPLLSKFILPWFGGSPTVWTTAMLFFQVTLFGGYAYAHLVCRWLSPRGQMAMHLTLLVAALCLLPLAPGTAWKPVDASEPTWRILGLLTACVGLPYLVLASTGPLVQAWFSRVYPGSSPYRLYALSNFGSLVALLSYPFYFEGVLDTAGQARLWSAGFVLFALLSAACAVRATRVRRGLGRNQAEPAHAPRREPTTSQRALWLALPALASTCLLATTNHVCQDVAVIPFLWVVPLALYLLTFIIAFDHPRWYRRRGFAATAVALIFLAGTLGMWPLEPHFVQELAIYFGTLFLICMLCHGELVRLRPDAHYLTSFYLAISAGGALGGIFVSLFAPQLFSTYLEWPISLVAGYLLAVGLLFADSAGGRAALSPATLSPVAQSPAALSPAALSPATPRRSTTPAGWALAIVGAGCIAYAQREETVATAITRNFYGVASVYERCPEDPEFHKFKLYNGRVVHGAQFVSPAKRMLPFTYYSHDTGVSRAIRFLQHEHPALQVGTVGLGVGTLAAYVRPGDRFTFYEINPDIERLARDYFSYLSAAGNAAQVVLGDARISMERESPRHFDLLVLDAFSGDAVPAHLLTAEAFEIYDRHLDPQHGTVAIHITNTYLDLAPVVRGLAERSGFKTARLQTSVDDDRGLFRTDWVILSRDKGLIEELCSAPNAVSLTDREIVWTDARSNLFEILK